MNAEWPYEGWRVRWRMGMLLGCAFAGALALALIVLHLLYGARVAGVVRPPHHTPPSPALNEANDRAADWRLAARLDARTDARIRAAMARTLARGDHAYDPPRAEEAP
jgi:hypothetical protein